ncbi:MAG: ATP-binding cassette domain-containing protein [Actinobacteria bacterium]|nr:ATP-binding cassette domain-containing protein [Actinomycetota bacterium]
MSERAIEVTGLRKSYGSFEAVHGIDLRVDRGQVFALLGPNGAGKTTTVEILEGHRSRTAGEVSVLGHDPGKGERSFKERVGIVLQETGVEQYLTVREVIDLYRSYYPSPRPTGEVISVVGLDEKAEAQVRTLSGGQQRRLDVAVGLAGDPELLFLDEPTTGFDPGARRNAWKMVDNLKSLGKTVFLTTHYMDEAQHLADRVAIISDGLIVAEGTPADLGGRSQSKTVISFHLSPDAPRPPNSLRGRASNDEFAIETDEPIRILHDLTGWALDSGADLEGLTVSRPSLEDVYLELAGGDATTEETG